MRIGRRARAGFTVVEALVAIIILAVGLLGLVSSSAAMLAQMTLGNQHAIASALAAERMERLRSVNACVMLANGTAVTRGMTESWTITQAAGSGGKASRNVDYKITYKAGAATRTQQVITHVPCT